jgi:response regulator RpfG family c-di-GMP phosphodiesterase
MTSKILNVTSKSEHFENEYVKLKNELEPLVEKVRNIFLSIQEIRLPDKDKEIQRIVQATNFIAKQLTSDAEELNDIATAASLCYVPKALFKERLAELPIMVSGIVQNQSMTMYNEYVAKMFKNIYGFHKIYDILNGVYENFDGSGMPSKLKAWFIPLGSRILRVAIDFEYFYSRNPKNVEKILPMMWTEIHRVYDFRVLAFYDQYLGYLNTMSTLQRRATEAVINPFVLEKNMVLSRNIITISGLKLLNVNAKLDDESIKKIQDAKNSEAYIGHIFVKVDSIPVIQTDSPTNYK